jgi:hypothetical protein
MADDVGGSLVAASLTTESRSGKHLQLTFGQNDMVCFSSMTLDFATNLSQH